MTGKASEQPHTVAHVLGEITWLLTQTPAYKAMPLASLEATVMPAILLQQFRIFYNAGQPIAFATWATVSDAVDAEITAKLAHGENMVLDLAQWKSGEHCWLMELVSPFATEENKLKEVLLEQIRSTIFNGRAFKACLLNPVSGKYEINHFNPKEVKNVP